MKSVTSVNTSEALNRQHGFTLTVALVALACFSIALGFAFHSVHQSANRLHARIQAAAPNFDAAPADETTREIIVDVKKGEFVQVPAQSRQVRIDAAVNGK
jgi:hypothetical protein